MTRTGLAAALALLTACTMGPDYERPKLAMPERHRDAGAEGPSFGELAWWRLYRDPTLHALLRVALAENLDLRIAVARIDQARAVLGDADLERLPRASARASLQRQHAPAFQRPSGVPRTIDTLGLSLDVGWELDLWGRLARASEAARAELLAAQYARRGVQIMLIADVASAYFELAALDEQLEITRATLETREEFLSLTRAQEAGGVVSGLDVAAAEAQLAAAQATIPDLERRIAQAENALRLLLGRNPGPVARSRAQDPAALAPPEVPAGLPSRLLERRPDILQAEQALVAANARVGAARASLFPSISLTGALGLLTLDFDRLFSSDAATWSAGVGAVQPILDADRNAYQVDLADARKREALLRYEQTVKRAFREVADALVARSKYAELERVQLTLVEAQRRAEQIARSRYGTGYSSYFDVINAGRDLFEAELALSSARLSSLRATVQLYRALGGGWQPPG